MCTRHVHNRLWVRSEFRCNHCLYTVTEESKKREHEAATGHIDWSYIHYFD
ncbi:hypothetical protein H4R18_004340 [Coemansia javaensis]|uniref:Uncharacterized protein n=1 Tax=Coemansia javaensis TaxID=2761396 RepID=A0A9W8LH89_9FUNG|nr:hypothetical protein H4R18_004340 [Coemansia javaensis]